MAEKTVQTNQETEMNAVSEQTRSDARYITPPVDIYEEGEQLAVVADLPGVDKESISLDMKEGILTIQGSAKATEPGSSIYNEFEFVNYYRQFELSEKVDVDKISADYNHGVLKINLPKAEQAKPRKIEVAIA